MTFWHFGLEAAVVECLKHFSNMSDVLSIDSKNVTASMVYTTTKGRPLITISIML